MSKTEKQELTPVILERSWPGVFNRAVRNEEGEVLELLQFQPGVVKVLTPEQLAAVDNDLGINLSIAGDLPEVEPEAEQDLVPAGTTPPTGSTGSGDGGTGSLLQFDERTRQVLDENDIKTLDQLEEIIATGDEWYQGVTGIGKKTARTIEAKLAE